MLFFIFSFNYAKRLRYDKFILYRVKGKQIF